MIFFIYNTYINVPCKIKIIIFLILQLLLRIGISSNNNNKILTNELKNLLSDVNIDNDIIDDFNKIVFCLRTNGRKSISYLTIELNCDKNFEISYTNKLNNELIDIFYKQEQLFSENELSILAKYNSVNVSLQYLI